MAVHFYQISTLATAVRHAVVHGRLAKQDDPLAPITFLLPRREAAAAVRRTLGDVLGATMLQFYGLGERILAEAGSPVREIDDLAVHRLVRQSLAEMAAAGELSSFTAMVTKPGFIRLLVEWLREMKAQGIPPEAVADDADRSGRRRDRQLAVLYQRYQLFLVENGYSDGDGLLWLAAEALETTPALLAGLGRLYVIGFDRFNPIQTRLLAALAGRVDHLAFYLLWDAERPANNVALARQSQTCEWIRNELNPVVDRFLVANPDALTHLRRCLFLSEAASPPSVAMDAAVRAIAAPSREAEVRQALRAVKQLLADGVSPEDIALMSPKPAAYRRLVQTVAEEYGLPVHLDLTLDRNPVVTTLINLLQLAPEFAWRPTLDALRSNYIHQRWLDQEQIELLDWLTRQRPVVAGRDQWTYALQTLEPDRRTPDEQLLAARLTPETLQAIETGLARFFDQLTPPERASYHQYTCWLQDYILGPFPGDEQIGEGAPGLALLANCLAGEPADARRDTLAMEAVLRTLRKLLQAAEIVSGDRPVPWADYRGELLASLPAEPLSREGLQPTVRFTPLEAGRGLAVDYLFVMGLAEGEFPEPPPPDPFYAPAERRDHPLPLQRQAPAEEASLWWQVLSNCRLRVTLLRPRLDDNGAPWLPSPYWQAVLDCTGIHEESPPLLQRPLPHEAAGPAECLVALAAQTARGVPPDLALPWLAARRAAQVMARRSGPHGPAEFEGIFQDQGLVSELSQLYGPRHGWSASRLNRYGSCPYGFFAQYVLGLEARPDPDEGFDPAQRGSLLHAVLEALYGRLTREDLAPTTPNQEAVLAQLDRACARLFDAAPQRYGFRPGPLWRYEQRELRRLLRALVRWECQENGERAPFQPEYQELRFGLGRDGLPHIHLASDRTEFKLHGIIDRLDVDGTGQASLIDYKSGSMAYSKRDIEQGLAFQTALYALAAERLLANVNRVSRSAYRHIPTREDSGRLDMPEGAEQDDRVRAAVDRAALFVSRVRQGIFPNAPGKGAIPCRRGCEFAGFCRVSPQSLAKARRQFG